MEIDSSRIGRHQTQALPSLLTTVLLPPLPPSNRRSALIFPNGRDTFASINCCWALGRFSSRHATAGSRVPPGERARAVRISALPLTVTSSLHSKLHRPSFQALLHPAWSSSSSLQLLLPSSRSPMHFLLPHTLHEKREAPHRLYRRSERLHPDAIIPIRIGLTQSNLENAEAVVLEVLGQSYKPYQR